MDFRYKVLVVEDDPSLMFFLVSALEAEGYDCITATNGKDAEALAGSHCPDIVLLDIGLPDATGLEVLTRLRVWTNVPVIIVSSHDAGSDKVRALELGADDYVVKPYGLDELLARMRVAIRRTGCAEPNNNRRLTVQGLTIDYEKCSVMVQGRDAELTRSEYQIISLLGEKIGKVVTYHEIITRIWGPNAQNGGQILRVNIANIRRKLCASPTEPKFIITVKGRGYMLSDGSDSAK